jgi:hypothetical protein
MSSHQGHSTLVILVCSVLLVLISASASHAQNWGFILRDQAAGTPLDQVNGIVGGTAPLFATILNYTETPASDDGMGQPASATLLDFAGFGWIRQPGQADLESRFVPDLRIPGFPQVPGSGDGLLPGSSGSVILGTFDLSGLAPGVYEEDYVVSAFPTDIDSTLVFQDFTGTLRLKVVVPAETSAAEPTPLLLFLSTAGVALLLSHPKRCRFTDARASTIASARRPR